MASDDDWLAVVENPRKAQTNRVRLSRILGY